MKYVASKIEFTTQNRYLIEVCIPLVVTFEDDLSEFAIKHDLLIEKQVRFGSNTPSVRILTGYTPPLNTKGLDEYFKKMDKFFKDTNVNVQTYSAVLEIPNRTMTQDELLRHYGMGVGNLPWNWSRWYMPRVELIYRVTEQKDVGKILGSLPGISATMATRPVIFLYKNLDDPDALFLNVTKVASWNENDVMEFIRTLHTSAVERSTHIPGLFDNLTSIRGVVVDVGSPLQLKRKVPQRRV
jgi:hypothetical protein